MNWEPTREMHDRLPAPTLAAFRLRDRDGVEYAVVEDGEILPGVPHTLVIPTSEAAKRGCPILFDTTGKENPR